MNKKNIFKLQKYVMLSLLYVTITTSASAIDVSAWQSTYSKGTTWTSSDGLIKTYARPDNFPTTYMDGSPRFNVLINREAYTGLYDSNNAWGGSVNFGCFDFKDGTPVDVVISCRKELGNYEIIPASAEINNVEKISDNILKFTISKANQNITLVLNGNYQTGDVLHLFCNDLDTMPNVEQKEGYSYDRNSKTYFFGPGYYDLNDNFSGSLSVSGERKIYLAGGAVVHGSLALSGTGGKIYGHGMVISTSGSELSYNYNDGGVVDGIICYRYRTRGWQTTYSSTKNATITNLKVICPYGGSSDGMDFTSCENMTFDNCFVRSMDDCIAIKGLAPEGTIPANGGIEKNLRFNRMQLWSDANNAFGIGAETIASSFESIYFTNSDVLYSYDDPTHHEELDERSAMNICCLHGTYFHDIHFENITVNRCERLIGLGFKSSFWFGSLLGDQSFEGEIKDVYFKNITCANNSGSSIANNVWLYGWHQDGTPDKFIHDIWFDNVSIEGQPFESWDNANLKTNNTDDLKLVYDLHFNELISDGINSLKGNKSMTLSNRTYDLCGRVIKTPHNGLYIQDGKIVFIK